MKKRVSLITGKVLLLKSESLEKCICLRHRTKNWQRLLLNWNMNSLNCIEREIGETYEKQSELEWKNGS